MNIDPCLLDFTRFHASFDERLEAKLTEWRPRQIAFTNGCFDLFHVGHLSILESARAQGDRLVVGINSDESVRRLKGNGRPIIRLVERAVILCAVRCVDAVVMFTEDTPLKLIAAIRPDVIVKGDDYEASRVVGVEFADAVIVKRQVQQSTTNIITRIRS